MNHTITVGRLLLVLVGVCGLAACVTGVAMLLASGNSETGEGGTGGCIVLIAGAVVLVGCVLGLVL